MEKTSGALLVEQEIGRFGPMNFSDFISLALYHPKHGYYSRKAPQRGRAGDYFTSLQVSDLFPKIVARAIVAMKKTMGTEQFSLIELGSGHGEFLVAALSALADMNEQKGVRVWAVETSAAARERITRVLSRFPKSEVVASLDEIDLAPGLEGCVFSNEFFDALPFHRLRFRNGEWKEIYVVTENGTLKELENLPSPAIAGSLGELSGVEFLDGQEIEFRPSINKWMGDISQILARGYVLTFDYGYPVGQLYDPVRSNGTWMCYSEHSANQNILEKIGRQDITAHVNFTQLSNAGRTVGLEPAMFVSQGIFLSYVGQDILESYLKVEDVVEQKKRLASVQQLIHPNAMGEKFWTLLQAKDVEIPDQLLSIPNRIKRLIG